MSVSAGLWMWQQETLSQTMGCSKSGLQMLRLALIPKKSSRGEMSSWKNRGGQEEGPGFRQLGP